MKAMRWMLLGGILAFGYWASQAQALPAFKKAFQEKYVEPSTSQEFKDAFKKESCSVCHVKGDSDKAHHNDYGKALAKVTGGGVAKAVKAAQAAGGKAAADAALANALKTLDAAFGKVEGEKSPSGPTYGELIKAGKLPK